MFQCETNHASGQKCGLCRDLNPVVIDGNDLIGFQAADGDYLFVLARAPRKAWRLAKVDIATDDEGRLSAIPWKDGLF